MDANPSLHPSDQTLDSFGLGKLDDRSARSVHTHLEACPDCRRRVSEMSSDSFLDRVRDAQKGTGRSTVGQSPGGGTPRLTGSRSASPFPADTLPPGLVDHPDYEIQRELGRGGMGVVYLAHNKLMGRDEVLKVMGQHIVERPGVLDRFLREIRAVARLRHANIVAAYSAVRLGASIVFAMEYVEGLDLSKMVKAKGPLPVGHACNFAYQAALGLQHAHEEGLVHRDIKPGNLMLSRKGEKATVKVLDFGLAKATREEQVDGGLTSEGQALGTPDFIAPEQILNAMGADIRADIYSLGGTLYYLLTGRPPFKAHSLYDMYQAHISRDADPLNLVRPEVPSELAALVAKMMAKDPARRFQTPDEVAQALTPFFKRANASFKSPKKSDVSQAGPTPADRPAPRVVSPPPPATDAGSLALREKRATEPTVNEARWESLIEFRETENSKEAAPAVAPTRRPPWIWPSAAVAMLLLGLLVAWMGGVIKVKTPEGLIVLENVPKDSEILVDGKKVNITWPGVGQPFEIRAVPGQRKLEVKKDGFKTFGEVVTVKADESEELAVRLEPLAAVGDPGGSPLGVVESPAQALGGKSPAQPADPLQVGTTWKGTSTLLATPSANKSNVGQSRALSLTIKDRAGVGFEAVADSMRGSHEARGTFKESLIAWKVALENHTSYEGRLEGNEIRGRFEGVNPNGKTYSGDFRLVLSGDLFTGVPASSDAVQADKPPVPPIDRGGFVPLFNGKDLTGWKPHAKQPGNWRVEHGNLVGSGPQASHLYSERGAYKDFHLRVSARINDRGNSGLFVRASSELARPANNPRWPEGYEAQINSTHWNEDRTGSLRAGANGAPVVVVRDSPVRPGQWFELEVIAYGNRIIVMVDGKKTAEYLDHDRLYTSGHIVLQQNDPQTVVEFRKIELGELNSTVGTIGGPSRDATSFIGVPVDGSSGPSTIPQLIKVLIITGDDVAIHDWPGTTEKFKVILNDPARFKVEVTATPAKDLTDSNLARYDVLLLNYKDTPQGGADTRWSEANKAAFLHAIKVKGKGLYVHHFASGAFARPNWVEFEKAIAGGWRSGGKTSPPHEFTVKKTDARSPIFQGSALVSFVHNRDELYSDCWLAPGSLVVATAYSDPTKPKGSGRDEPVIWVNQYGLGRVVNNVLGHDTVAMSDPNYQAWVRRCVEWVGGAGGSSTEVAGDAHQARVSKPAVSPTAKKAGDRRAGLRRRADAKEFLGKYYKVFAQQLSWHEAKARCQELGGRLAVVSNEDENRFLTSLVKEQGLGGAWLGATDEQVEGRWSWVDGTPLGFSNWDLPNKQPNNKLGIEHYMVLLTRFNGSWCDQPDDGRQEHPGFVCQWD